MNLTLRAGWLQNVQQYNDNETSGPKSNVNTVYPGAVVQFTPVGYYSDKSHHLLLNTSFQGVQRHLDIEQPSGDVRQPNRIGMGELPARPPFAILRLPAFPSRSGSCMLTQPLGSKGSRNNHGTNCLGGSAE